MCEKKGRGTTKPKGEVDIRKRRRRSGLRTQNGGKKGGPPKKRRQRPKTRGKGKEAQSVKTGLLHRRGKRIVKRGRLGRKIRRRRWPEVKKHAFAQKSSRGVREDEENSPLEPGEARQNMSSREGGRRFGAEGQTRKRPDL